MKKFLVLSVLLANDSFCSVGNPANSWLARTPLHDAAEKNDRRRVEELLRECQEAGLSIDPEDYYGVTPLIMALENHGYAPWDSAAELFLKMGARIDERAVVALLDYIRKNPRSKFMVSVMEEVKAYQEAHGRSDIRDLLARSAGRSFFEELTTEWAKVSQEGVDHIKHLLKKEQGPTEVTKKLIALCESKDSFKEDEALALMQAGADVNETRVDGTSIWQTMVQYNSEICCKEALVHGANLDTATLGFWRTPMHDAAEMNNSNMVCELLNAQIKAHVSSDIVDCEGETPLATALKTHGYGQVAKVLLAHGAKIDEYVAKVLLNVLPQDKEKASKIMAEVQALQEFRGGRSDVYFIIEYSQDSDLVTALQQKWKEKDDAHARFVKASLIEQMQIGMAIELTGVRGFLEAFVKPL